MLSVYASYCLGWVELRTGKTGSIFNFSQKLQVVLMSPARSEGLFKLQFLVLNTSVAL